MSQDGRNPAQLQGDNDSGPPAFQSLELKSHEYLVLSLLPALRFLMTSWNRAHYRLEGRSNY